ncbi:Filamentous hemagglutinin [Labeo rohita]|uniref:Filamentous hemagglutinin n=1 Tax=Labeo rohita TaxID=84645 RepID=A0ABQ8L5E9_LABRO|nr:Filamentous hemagglutinin [Labeo rohita]
MGRRKLVDSLLSLLLYNLLTSVKDRNQEVSDHVPTGPVSPKASVCSILVIDLRRSHDPGSNLAGDSHPTLRGKHTPQQQNTILPHNISDCCEIETILPVVHKMIPNVKGENNIFTRYNTRDIWTFLLWWKKSEMQGGERRGEERRGEERRGRKGVVNEQGRTMHITWTSDDTKQAAVLICHKIKVRVPVKHLEIPWQKCSFHVRSFSHNKENQRQVFFFRRVFTSYSMKLASINVPPRRGDAILGGKTIFIFQDGRDLEDYVEEFISICHLASCDDVCLMEGFWCGLDDDLRFVMPKGEPCWTLTQYINILLSAWGSELCLDEVEEDYNPIQPHLADPEPEPTADGSNATSATQEPSPIGATERAIATELEEFASDQVREPATEPATVDVPDGREGAEDSTAHCTTAEGEQRLDLGQIFLEQNLTNVFVDVYEDMPALLPPSKLHDCLDFPPTLPLSIVSAASVPPPLSPGSPSAHPQLTICAVGSPQVCQSPSVSWLEDPSSSPPASESWTPPRPFDPAAPPRLSAPSSPPSPVGPPAPPGSIVPPAPPWSVVAPPSPLDSTPPAAPRRSVTPALWTSSLPRAQPWSSVAPAPPRTSGSPPPPRSPEPWAPPGPSGSSVSPRIIGSPSPPRALPPPAPPPSVGPMVSSALPPPWLLPPSAPPWGSIMAAVWVSPDSSCSSPLLSPPWLLPPSSPPWTIPSPPWTPSIAILPGVRPPLKPPPKTVHFVFPVCRREDAPSGRGR